MSVMSLQVRQIAVTRHTVHPQRSAARISVTSAPAAVANRNRPWLALAGKVAVAAAILAAIVAIVGLRVGFYTAAHLDQPVFRDLAARVFG